MIYFDVTKSGDAGHRSGLMRVSSRLAQELGGRVTPVRWPTWDRKMTADDWFFTAELFSEAERPGITEFIARAPGRKGGIFHDAIPLKFPHITWPQSVARHPGYMKLLAGFDRVWAVSKASQAELAGFWKWQGLGKIPLVEVIALGADFDGGARLRGVVDRATPLSRGILSVGILEPRKNQMLLLEVSEQLWTQGIAFELDLVGRVNPHFGQPIVKRIKQLQRKFPGLRYHAAAGDAELAALYAGARVSVFPTLAEGCGLPLLESLWRGVPCVCSDLPVLRENADGGGCVPVTVDDRTAWADALRQILADDDRCRELRDQARSRALPTWAEAAARLGRDF
ncbi:MAG: glycosyl transferase group 1 [Verrucomicrobia bacterium]|nr:glycosyl transferase group 1 [Verrucomicrobiota bacterium]